MNATPDIFQWLRGRERHALTETELLSLRSAGRRLAAEETERLYELEHHPACPDCGAWGAHECPADHGGGA